jgi:hypothetical protein
MQTSSSSKEAPKKDNERKLEIAKHFAESMLAKADMKFNAKHVAEQQPDRGLSSESIPIMKMKRMGRMLKLLDNLKHSNVYSIEIEKQMITESNMVLLLDELAALEKRDCVRMSNFISILTDHLQVIAPCLLNEIKLSLSRFTIVVVVWVRRGHRYLHRLERPNGRVLQRRQQLPQEGEARRVGLLLGHRQTRSRFGGILMLKDLVVIITAGCLSVHQVVSRNKQKKLSKVPHPSASGYFIFILSLSLAAMAAARAWFTCRWWAPAVLRGSSRFTASSSPPPRHSLPEQLLMKAVWATPAVLPQLVPPTSGLTSGRRWRSGR